MNATLLSRLFLNSQNEMLLKMNKNRSKISKKQEDRINKILKANER